MGATLEQVNVAGVDIDAVSLAEAAEHVVSSAELGEGGIVVTPNVDHLRAISAGSPLAVVYGRATLVLADGMPVLWASRIQGTPLPERVCGSDLPSAVAEAAAGRASIYLAGGRPGVVDRLGEQLRAEHPGLDVAGWCCPEVSVDDLTTSLLELELELEATRPRIVFLGFGSPKQELMVLHLASRFPDMWFLCIGAGLDLHAGEVQRAPVWAQRIGAEWLVRLAHEPRRLARRYLVDDLPYAVRLLGGALFKRLAGRLEPAPAGSG